MQINFKIDTRKISIPARIHIYDLGQVETTLDDFLNNTEITITDNFLPVLLIRDTGFNEHKYLISELDYDWGNLPTRGSYNITEANLIEIGAISGGGGIPYTPPYRTYTANLSWTGSTVDSIIHINEIGVGTIVRSGPGEFRIPLSTFDITKIYVSVTPGFYKALVSHAIPTDNDVYIKFSNPAIDGESGTDSLLAGCMIEIRIYD